MRKPLGKQPLVRQRRRWKNNVMMDLKKVIVRMRNE
jgi:hypothetical protein